jgi:hypothetical protein
LIELVVVHWGIKKCMQLKLIEYIYVKYGYKSKHDNILLILNIKINSKNKCGHYLGIW